MSSRRSLALVTGALLALAAVPAAASDGPIKRPGPVHSPGDVSSHQMPKAGAALLVTFVDRPERAVAQRRLDGLGDIEPIVPEAGVWRLRPASVVEGVRTRAAARAGVAGAEWALARSSDQTPPAPDPPGPFGVADPIADPLFVQGTQWWASERGAPSWSPDLTTVGPRPRIAILDSGVDRGHEEWGGPASPLVAPRNTLHRNADASDWGYSGHGTHVAGIAAAPANGRGIVGVAPSGPGAGEVIPVRIADSEGRSSDATMIAGIRWAVLRDAKVINISAGGPGYSRAFERTVLWATARGALIVASVGNDGGGPGARTVNYPAGYRRVLGVAAQCDGAVSPDCPARYGLARFSNRNSSVDLVAPGVRIVSSVPMRVTEGQVTPGYAFKDGTSMAAPYAAGVAALVQAANGNRLSPYQVMRHLQSTARRMEPGGRNNRTGYGLVDPLAALTRTVPRDDPREPNDDVALAGRPLVPRPGQPLRIRAAADSLHDADDVYPVALRRGDVVQVTMTRRTGLLDLYLWRPGTRTVQTSGPNVRRNLLRFRGGPARSKRVSYLVERPGVHYVNVYARAGRGDYTLDIAVRRP